MPEAFLARIKSGRQLGTCMPFPSPPLRNGRACWTHINGGMLHRYNVVLLAIISIIAYYLLQHHSTMPPKAPNSKRGLAWPREGKQEDVLPFTKPGSKISWLYNWSPHGTKNAESLQFVPMQWNAGGIDELQRNVKRDNAQTLLAFNEPELPDQSNMSAEFAAEQWLKHIEPLRKQGVRCGSPGISSAGHAVGWLKDFRARIQKGGSDVDFWCLHWYGVDIGGFYDYIWSTHHQLDASKKVWITEFAATNWNKDNPLPRDHVENFARETIKYLETLDWVEKYCWFGAMRDPGTVGKWARLLDDDGKLTPLGKDYVGGL